VTEGSRLRRIKVDLLQPFVRRALGDEAAVITAWDCEVIKGQPTPPGGLVCRLTGRAGNGDYEVPWSLYLRVPEPPMSHRDPIRRAPFHRELLLYRSGVLGNLPEGTAAPRLLGVTEYPDDEPWMWLEDVTAAQAREWPEKRFELAAFHFGRLQGAFLDDPDLSAHPQLDRTNWLKPGLARIFKQVPHVLARFQAHPLTGALWDGNLGTGVRRLWAERGTFADALDRMPGTLCHGDFCIPNLMSRRLGDGRQETVLIDWEYGGWSQIGGDIAGLIADSSILPVRRKVADPAEFTEMMLEGYLSGLRDAGREDALTIARFACLATLALPWGLLVLLSLNGTVLQQEPGEGSHAGLKCELDTYVRRQEFVLRVADRARKLLRTLPGTG